MSLLRIRNVSRIASALVWVIAAFTVVTTVWGTISNYSSVPYWDQWEGFILFYEQWLSQDVDKLALLFSQHNEHRIALPRLFFLLGCTFGSCDNRISIATIYTTQLMTVALFCGFFLKAGGSRKECFGLVLPFLVIASYSWVQKENLTWGFQVQFVGVYFWSILSIFALAMINDSGSTLKQIAAMFTCILAASFATFSMANGILVMPFLILLAFFYKLSFRKHLLLFIVTIFLAITYFSDYVSVAGHSQPLEIIIEQPIQLFIYVCAYLGGLFSGGLFSVSNHEVALVFGGGYILIVILIAYQHVIGKRTLNYFQLALFAIVGFILLTSIVTGLGRVSFSIEQAFSSRYATPLVIGWCALLLLLITGGRRSRLFGGVVGIFFLLQFAKIQSEFDYTDSSV